MVEYGVMGFLIILFCILVYFIPWIVASNRKMENVTGVALLNIFLGWTFLGWLAALIWSVCGEKRIDREVIIHHYHDSPRVEPTINDDLPVKRKGFADKK